MLFIIIYNKEKHKMFTFEQLKCVAVLPEKLLKVSLSKYVLGSGVMLNISPLAHQPDIFVQMSKIKLQKTQP